MKLKYTLWPGIMMVLMALSVQLSSCGGSDPTDSPTETDRVIAVLTSRNWNVQSVTVDGVDQSALFTNFTISFSISSFTTTNGGPVWPASGTWSFVDDTATAFNRDDGLSVKIIEAINTSLKLQLTWSKTTIGGRKESVSGVHIFSFN